NGSAPGDNYWLRSKERTLQCQIKDKEQNQWNDNTYLCWKRKRMEGDDLWYHWFKRNEVASVLRMSASRTFGSVLPVATRGNKRSENASENNPNKRKEKGI
ncbi:13882_t:CDS:1, partial [Dentiscutata erythropus]